MQHYEIILIQATTFVWVVPTYTQLAGFPISILVVGWALPPFPIGMGTWCPKLENQLATSWGAVYISSIQHTKKNIWKENYVVWIVLEPWLNACPWMSLTGFSKFCSVAVVVVVCVCVCVCVWGGGDSFPVERNAKFCWKFWGNLIYILVGIWGGVIFTILNFFKAKINIS